MKRKMIITLGGTGTSIRGMRAINWDILTSPQRYLSVLSEIRAEIKEAAADDSLDMVREVEKDSRA